MSLHVPLYKSVYRVLRALASVDQLVSLLNEPVTSSESSTLASLLANMAKCVHTYQSKLQ